MNQFNRSSGLPSKLNMTRCRQFTLSVSFRLVYPHQGLCEVMSQSLMTEGGWSWKTRHLKWFQPAYHVLKLRKLARTCLLENLHIPYAPNKFLIFRNNFISEDLGLYASQTTLWSMHVRQAWIFATNSAFKIIKCSLHCGVRLYFVRNIAIFGHILQAFYHLCQQQSTIFTSWYE